MEESEKIHAEFDEKISSVNDDIFWLFVKSWKDLEDLITTMKNWDTDSKRHGLCTIYRLETENNPLNKTFNTLTNYYNTTMPSRKLSDLMTHWINNEHRYLQEEFILHFVLPLIKEAALRSSTKRFDARNAFSYKQCEEIVKKCPDVFSRL